MSTNNKELAELIKELFGVAVTDWGEQEDFNATNMTTVHEDNTETVSDKGHFSVYNFIGEDENRYKLAEWGDEFQEDDELVDWLKHAEHTTVKDYEQIEPRSKISKYSLYKLIPYTVNGEPQW